LQRFFQSYQPLGDFRPLIHGNNLLMDAGGLLIESRYQPLGVSPWLFLHFSAARTGR
jgi:hypothetical protein